MDDVKFLLKDVAGRSATAKQPRNEFVGWARLYGWIHG